MPTLIYYLHSPTPGAPSRLSFNQKERKKKKKKTPTGGVILFAWFFLFFAQPGPYVPYVYT